MSFTVAIVGRPNVGKSTLFNRLTGTRHALVHDMPGVTRDRREGDGSVGPLQFKVIDTAGLEDKRDEEALESRMMDQTEKAIEEADVSLLVLDGKAGVTPVDDYFVRLLRKKNRPMVVVVNKCEARGTVQSVMQDVYRLHSSDPVFISAEHGEGMAELYDALEPYDVDEYVENDNNKEVQIAIIGRPNAGKSTLVNQLLKEQRVLTGPEAGITRDAISISWSYKDTPIKLIDTAGVRKKKNVTSALEKMSLADSFRAVQYAQVVVLLIDATAPLEKQDLTLAHKAYEEGRALIIALNKWDLIEDKDAYVYDMRHSIEKILPDMKGVSLVYLSALYDSHVETVIEKALEAYKLWNVRVNTTELNRWLSYAIERHTPPLTSSKRRLTFKYVTQHKTRPPTFMLFVNKPKEVPESYLRYLRNSLRECFDLPGVPLRLLMKKNHNPYVKKD